MNTTYYYKSPIGIIKFICNEAFLVEMSFVEKEQKNLDKYPSVVSTCKEQLDLYFAGNLERFTIPLEFTRGTDFQRSVWSALESIPYGETRSYKDIASQIGNPKAARAVGGANNKNPISIVIPCHRVIGSNGKLVGYASGVEKKEILLKLEEKK